MSLASLEWGRTNPTGGKARGLQRSRDRHAACSCCCSRPRASASWCSTARSAPTPGCFLRQGLRFAFGMAAFFVFSQVPPRYLRIWTPWAFFLGVALLIAVAIEGEIAKGGQRWLDLGVVTFQPSELLKLAAPMMVAWFMHDRPLPPTFLQVVTMTLIVMVPGRDDRRAARPRHRDARDRGRRPRDPARRHQRARDPCLRGARGGRRAACSGTTCATTSARACSCS